MMVFKQILIITSDYSARMEPVLRKEHRKTIR